MTFWACFIPVPLMGLALRGFLPPMVPYALSDAASLGLRPIASYAKDTLQGFPHHRKLGTRPGG
jgi:hypothetical protein